MTIARETGDSPTPIGVGLRDAMPKRTISGAKILTNPVGPQTEDPSFAEQLAPIETRPGGGHVTESVPAIDDKVLHNRFSRAHRRRVVAVASPQARHALGARGTTSTSIA